MENETPTVQQEPTGSVFSPAQEADLRRLKSYFPSRIVWGGFDANGEFYTGADHTRRRMNAFLRKPGHIVATIA
mgnify:FL=1